MKRFTWLLIAVLIVGINSGCKKDKSCSPRPAADEIPQMEAFASVHGMTATAHSSGLYYQIIDTGAGPKASATSRIAITYTGKLMNGQTFDEQLVPNTNKPWTLGGLIEGWIIGIPLINEGGHIKLLIPSSLAYGCERYYEIPGNSVLYFDIHLVDVQ